MKGRGKSLIHRDGHDMAASAEPQMRRPRCPPTFQGGNRRCLRLHIHLHRGACLCKRQGPRTGRLPPTRPSMLAQQV